MIISPTYHLITSGQNKTRLGSTRQGKTRQGKARQDKTRQEKRGEVRLRDQKETKIKKQIKIGNNIKSI